MTKRKERWVWVCGHDSWGWEDGYRCYSASRKPVDSKSKAEAALAKHKQVCGGRGEWRYSSQGSVYKLKKRQRW